MRQRTAVLLVAGREARERMRSRTYRITTLVLVLGLIAALVALKLVASNQRAPLISVAVTPQVSVPLREALLALGPATGTRLRLDGVASVSSAATALRTHHVVAAVTSDHGLLLLRPETTSTSAASRVVGAVGQQIRLQGGLEQAGLSPAQAVAAQHAPLLVRTLKPALRPPTRQPLGLAGAVLVYLLVTTYGSWMATGVISEKSSRVVEVLLSTLRPADLLVGKILGIGTAALSQVLLLAIAAIATIKAAHLSILGATPVTGIALVVVWSLLGFALYAAAFAAAGSLASRIEDAQIVLFPVALPLLVSYLLTFPLIVSGHTSTLLVVLSLLPPSAPVDMLARTFLGPVPGWQMALSIVLTALATVGVGRVAITIYGRSVLRVGQRVRLRDILRREG